MRSFLSLGFSSPFCLLLLSILSFLLPVPVLADPYMRLSHGFLVPLPPDAVHFRYYPLHLSFTYFCIPFIGLGCLPVLALSASFRLSGGGVSLWCLIGFLFCFAHNLFFSLFTLWFASYRWFTRIYSPCGPFLAAFAGIFPVRILWLPLQSCIPSIFLSSVGVRCLPVVHMGFRLSFLLTFCTCAFSLLFPSSLAAVLLFTAFFGCLFSRPLPGNFLVLLPQLCCPPPRWGTLAAAPVWYP